MARYHVTIYGQDYQAMADLVRKYQIHVLRQTAKQLAGGDYSVDAIVDGSLIPRLRQRGYRVDQFEDVDIAGRASLLEVGQGNRYENKPGKPR